MEGSFNSMTTLTFRRHLLDFFTSTSNKRFWQTWKGPERPRAAPFLEFDPDEDSRSLATFDGSDGMALFEELMKAKLIDCTEQYKEEKEEKVHVS
jgi:hypothetical protein